MKLKSKLKLYEQFINENNTKSTTDVAIDQTTTPAGTTGETIRTEVIRDVDSILNNLIELSDRIGESASIDLEIDELYEELFDLTNVSELNEGILDFIKSPIKFMKIKKNLKAYQKALVQKAINDVDFAKKKQAGDAGVKGKDDKRIETLTQANQAKNKALDDQLSAIGERMTELSSGDEGLGKVVSIGKTKSKLAAAKIVMKATSGEEAKQLKLEIDTLANRIADDEKSLKDYAKKAGPADHTDSDDQSGDNDNTSSKDQLDGIGKEKDETPEEKEARIKKEKADENAPKIEKLEDSKTKAKEAYDAVDAGNKIEKAKAKLEYVQIQLELAKLKEEDAEVIKGFEDELKALKVTASLTVVNVPAGNAGYGESVQLDGSGRLAPIMEDSVVTEATLGELMAFSDDDYKYLKGEAKKLGVKVSVSTGKDSMYDDMGYDTLSFSGDKAAILKLAAISGHDADICSEPGCGGYELEESTKATEYVSKEVEENAEEFVEEAKIELPKTIKLDEGLSVAEKFAILMNK